MDMLEDVAKVSVPTLVIESSTSPLSSREFRREFSAEVAAAAPLAQIVSVQDSSGSSAFFSEGATVPPAVAAIEHFLESLPETPANRAQVSGLSERELEVLRLLADGKSNGEIAADLVISPNTVNRHVSNIYAKTGASNRAEATSFAHRQGLI
jgi:DNA-binding NarL/FixJ family response regulator